MRPGDGRDGMNQFWQRCAVYFRLLLSAERFMDWLELMSATMRGTISYMLHGRGALHVCHWVIVASGGIRYAVPPRDNSLASAEPGVRNGVVVPEAIRQLQGSGAGVYVDIGANLGYVCMTMAQRFPENRIVAIEPIPWLTDALKRTASLNGFRNVTIVGRAIASTDQIELAIPVVRGVYFTTLSSSAGVRDGHLPGASVERLRVSAIGLDELLHSLRVPPSSVVCIKVDVEGAEVEVLKTAAETLRYGPPVIFEALDQLRREAAEALLAGYGYSDVRALDGTNFVARTVRRASKAVPQRGLLPAASRRRS